MEGERGTASYKKGKHLGTRSPTSCLLTEPETSQFQMSLISAVSGKEGCVGRDGMVETGWKRGAVNNDILAETGWWSWIRGTVRRRREYRRIGGLIIATESV